MVDRIHSWVGRLTTHPPAEESLTLLVPNRHHEQLAEMLIYVYFLNESCQENLAESKLLDADDLSSTSSSETSESNDEGNSENSEAEEEAKAINYEEHDEEPLQKKENQASKVGLNQKIDIICQN